MVGPWVARSIHGSHSATGRPYFSSTARLSHGWLWPFWSPWAHGEQPRWPIFFSWEALTCNTETHGGPAFDVAVCCQPHEMGHKQHPNLKMDMDCFFVLFFCFCLSTVYHTNYHGLIGFKCTGRNVPNSLNLAEDWVIVIVYGMTQFHTSSNLGCSPILTLISSCLHRLMASRSASDSFYPHAFSELTCWLVCIPWVDPWVCIRWVDLTVLAWQW